MVRSSESISGSFNAMILLFIHFVGSSMAALQDPEVNMTAVSLNCITLELRSRTSRLIILRHSWLIGNKFIKILSLTIDYPYKNI